MSHNDSWDVNKYREEHESEDQWQLRRSFLLKWKDHYAEARLVCLARVFTNIEFMGCRYPNEVMREVASLSAEVAKQYRNNKQTKLQRTFVSASDAAEDRAKGVKREGGVIIDPPETKSAKIKFVPQGQSISNGINGDDIENSDDRLLKSVQSSQSETTTETESSNTEITEILTVKQENGIQEVNVNRDINYMDDMLAVECLDPRDFNEDMFNTVYGKFVFVIRPWAHLINNLISSCTVLKIPLTQKYTSGVFTITLNHQTLASASGDKNTAKSTACQLAWKKLSQSTIVLVLKEQWVTQNDSRISVDDMAGKKPDFGEPIEDSVALKMMKLMGWKGGGLGADNQGMAEPIRPNFRMVRRAGLGHEGGGADGLRELQRAGFALMRRRGTVLDADLVFASDFSPEERAVLHKCANNCGLVSKSYGKGADRFLVVTNKLRPLELVRAVVECGGETPKYRVFIPASIGKS